MILALIFIGVMWAFLGNAPATWMIVGAVLHAPLRRI